VDAIVHLDVLLREGPKVVVLRKVLKKVSKEGPKAVVLRKVLSGPEARVRPGRAPQSGVWFVFPSRRGCYPSMDMPFPSLDRLDTKHLRRLLPSMEHYRSLENLTY
jgi:hypothetical protein